MMNAATQLRLTGLATGLDTDAIIQQLGRVHTARIDTVKRDRQFAVWQQQTFRNTINMINDFMRSNLNVVNPASNFRSASAFAKFSFGVSMGGLKTETAKNAAANILSVTANADLRNFNQTVQQVSQLATRDTWSGSEAGLREITTDRFDLMSFIRTDDAGRVTSAANASFVLSIDNVSRTITLDGITMRDIYNSSLNRPVPDQDNIVWNDVNVGVSGGLFVDRGDGARVSVSEYVRIHSAAAKAAVEVGDHSFTNMTDADVVDFLNDPANAGFLTGEGKTVETFGNHNTRSTAFANALNAEITRQFGSDFANIVKVTDKGELTFTKPGSTLTINEALGMGDTMRNFGISNGTTTGAVGTKTLDDLFRNGFFDMKNEAGQTMLDGDGNPRKVERSITINGTRIDLNANDTLHTMMNKINGSGANVTLSYNSAADRFELASKEEGSAANIGDVTGATAQFFEMLKIGKAVEVERQMFNASGDSMWVKGYKLAIGGEFIQPLQAGERMVAPAQRTVDTAPATGLSPGTIEVVTESQSRVWIDANGNIKTQTQTTTTDLVRPFYDSSDPTNDGKFEFGGIYYDLNDTTSDHTGTGRAAFEAAIKADDAANGTTTSFRIVHQGVNHDGTPGDISMIEISRVTTAPAVKDYERQPDGSFTSGTDLYADMNAVLNNYGMSKDSMGTRAEGKNLHAVINGVQFIRQTNSFTHEGMTYTFHNVFNDKDEHGVAIDPSTITAAQSIRIEVAKNTSDIVESIRGFVDEYNKILSHLNSLLGEQRDRDFRPLSDDEKKAMSEDEIKQYEERAKLGILANDSDLRRIINDLRASIYTKVEGVGLTMSDIGITTSSNWRDGGRLIIDENKLNAALESNYDTVVQLFTKSSDIPASDMANRSTRNGQIGIAQRIHDIMNDAVRTTRDNNNRKGTLIERAGIEGDVSVAQNAIQSRIDIFDKRISTLLERWYRQENSLYAMFARMEGAMMKMQSQQTNLAQLMSQNGM